MHLSGADHSVDGMPHYCCMPAYSLNNVRQMQGIRDETIQVWCIQEDVFALPVLYAAYSLPMLSHLIGEFKIT